MLSPSERLPLDYKRWTSCISRLASDHDVYMKFSGLFNEFAVSPSPETTPDDIPTFLETVKPYLDHVFSSGLRSQTMFGSDWPVCNVGGPKGEAGNWKFWVEILTRALEERNLTEQERESVWYGAGCEAYGVEL